MAKAGTLKINVIGDAADLNKKMGGVNKTMLGVSAAAAGAALVFKGAADDYNAGVRSLRVGTGATGDDLAALTSIAKDVSGKTTQAFSDVGQAVADLNTRTGQTGKPLGELARQFLDLERITGEAASTTIPAITRVFGDWSVKTGDQSETMDKLFRVSQTTGIGIGTLSEKVVASGAPLREFGFDLDTATALLGKWEKEGVNMEAVLSGMKIGLGKWTKEGKNANKELLRLQKEMQAGGDTTETTTEIFEVFGQRAGIDIVKALEEGRFNLDELEKSLASNTDTIAKATAETTTLSERFGMLKDRVMVALGPIGEVGGVASGVVAALGPMVFGLGQVAPHVAKAAKAVGSGVASMGSAMGRGATAVVQGAASMGAAVGRAAISVATSTASMVASAARATAAAVASVARQVAAWVVLGIQSLANAARIAVAWVIAMGPIALVVAAVVTAAVLIIKNWDKIKRFLLAVWDKIKAVAGRAFGFMKNLFLNFTPIGQIIKNWDKIKNVILGVWETIKGGVRSGINFIIRALNTFIRGINRVKVPSWVPGIGGKGVSLPLIPELAKGGITLDEGLVNVHPQEAILPLRDDVLGTLADKITAAGGGGGTIVLENRVFLDGKEVWNSVKRHAIADKRRNVTNSLS